MELNEKELMILIASLEQYYDHEPLTEVDDVYEKLRKNLYEINN